MAFPDCIRCQCGARIVECPAHEDKQPSLSWRLAGDTVLLHCFAGCTFDEIRRAVA